MSSETLIGELDADADFAEHGFSPQIVKLRLDEDIKVRPIELAASHLLVNDVQGQSRRHGRLVGSVIGDERVVDIADRHDAGLRRNFLRGYSVWIAGAVQAFMMF